MQHWFVYYKVTVDDQAAVVQWANALFATLYTTTGIRGRLMMRSDDANPLTLMEVYEGIIQPTNFGAALEAALAGSPFSMSSIVRRTEHFIAL